MKIYYDMFIPFMPDSDVDGEGNLVPSKRKMAGRKAMIELANFQGDGNISHLYNSVLEACLYQEVDVINTICNIPEEVEIPNVSIQVAVDMCAKMLIRSVNPNNGFDINQFAGILLTAAHFALEAVRSEKEAKASEVTTQSEEAEKKD